MKEGNKTPTSSIGPRSRMSVFSVGMNPTRTHWRARLRSLNAESWPKKSKSYPGTRERRHHENHPTVLNCSRIDRMAPTYPPFSWIKVRVPVFRVHVRLVILRHLWTAPISVKQVKNAARGHRPSPILIDTMPGHLYRDDRYLQRTQQSLSSVGQWLTLQHQAKLAVSSWPLYKRRDVMNQDSVDH